MQPTEPLINSTPALSVIMPTHKRQAMIRETLQALADQGYPAERFEVVVMCDGDDETYHALQDLLMPYTLRVLRQPQSGPAAARNNAARAATGRIILLLDDD